jgi:hypothetical protein
MPQTKAQVLADLQASLDAAFINPDIVDKRHLLGQMFEAQSVLGALNPTGNAVTPGDVIAGIDGSADIDLIKGLLTDIKLELINSKSIADILIQDYSTPTRYFVRQDVIDQSTGAATVTILNLDGSTPNPAPIQPFQPVKAASNNQVAEDLYIPIIAGTGYAIGDSLSNVRLINGETGLITASLWYNLTSGSTIAVAPPIANLKGYADKVEELLVSIASKLPTLGLNTAANSLPVSLPSDGVLPLPTGAATALLQADEITKLTSIDTKISTLATVTKQVDMLVALNEIATSNATPNIRPLTANDVVTVVVPSTLATTAKQDATNLALTDLGAKLDAIGQIEAQISAKLPTALGTKPAAESLSIAIASDSSFPLAIDAATATLQQNLNYALGQLGDPTIALSESDATATIAALIRLLIQQSRVDGEAELSAIGDYLSDDIAGDPTQIANLKSILRGFWKDSDPATTRNLLNQILQSIINGQAATQITNLPTDPAQGALQIVGNTSLNAIASGINTIATNTGRISQYQFMPAETSAGVVFLLRTDGVTGQTVKIDLTTGLAFIPGSIELTDPIVSTPANTKVIEPNEFVAKTTVAGKWAIDDILTRVTIVDTANNTITATIWQDAAGNLLSTIPVLGVDVEDTNKTQLATLKTISTKLNTGSSAFANAIGINFSAKTLIGGFTTPNSVVNANLLDGTGAGLPIDVRDFNSLQLTIIQANIIGTAIYTAQSAIDAAFTIGVKNLEFIDQVGTITGSFTVTNGATTFCRLNLANENYIRITRNNTTANCTMYGVLSQQPITSRVTASLAANQAIGSVGTISSDQLAITGGTLTPDTFFTNVANGTTTAQGQVGTWGVSNVFAVVVSTVTGTLPTLDITVQESNDAGATWRTAYVFPTISAIGTYTSPLIPQVGRQYQYVQIVNGTAASFFRGIYKYPSNVAAGVATASGQTAISASIQGLATDIAAIRANTARISQFAFQLAEDTAGTVFLIKTDTVSGASTNINVATGLAFTPVGAIELTDPITGSDLQLEPNEFEAITAVAGQWAIRDVLTRLLIVNTATSAVTATIWQSATGTTLTTIPVLGVDAIDTDKQQLAILRSIDSKTFAQTPTTKTTIVGFTSIAAVNNNLLDPTGNGAWTDVRAFQSCELTVVTGPSALTFTGLIGAVDAAGTSPAQIPAFNSGNGVLNANNSFPASSTLKLRYDLTGVSFVRFGQQSALFGNKITGVFSSFATANQTYAQIAGTVPVVPVGTTTVASQIPQATFDLTGAIGSSQVSAAISINPGQSYQLTINIGSITGTLAQSIVRIQESGDTTNSIWRNVYTFEPITVANGNRPYKSPVITASGNKYRLIEAVSGIGPSINRSVIRSTINAPGLINQDTRSQTIYNANLASIDAAAYGVIRAITVTPTVATPLWLQIHDTINPIAAGAQPKQSIRIPVDGLVLGSAYFGNNGRQLGSASDPRIGISTSANGYTAIALAANTVQLYIESI